MGCFKTPLVGNKRKFVTIPLIIYANIVFAAPDFDRAEKEIKFLNPGDVKEFPAEIKKTLERERCLIPTVPGNHGPTGWTKGSFAKKNQVDWAVLCSNKSGKSEVQIVWCGKSSPCSNSFGLSENRNYLQVQDADKIIFSRSIDSIGSAEVIKYLLKAKAPLPSSLGQDGIVDAFIGKGSTIHFCTSGSWQEVLGSD